MNYLPRDSSICPERNPSCVSYEDAHWSDPTTLEALSLVIEQVEAAQVLVVLTYRPEFEPAWRDHGHVTTYTLNRLSRRQTVGLVTGVTRGKSLPDEVLDQIVDKTDGIPLFVEELTKSVLESEWLEDTGERYQLSSPLPPFAIPTTLQDSLMARLDRLAEAKEVMQLGATIGREFSYTLLRALTSLSDSALQEALGQVLEAELISQRGQVPGSIYSFKHALIQDAVYASMLRSTRQQVHQEIARTLETQFSETVGTRPELLAHHYTVAAQNELAIPYWQQAGEKAIQRSAHTEAIAHLTKGLELIRELSESSHQAQQELKLQRSLGVSLLATKGFAAPEVEAVYTRARELCYQIRDTSHIYSVLFGLWGFYNVRAALHTARGLAEELLDLAQRNQNPAVLMGYRALGDTLSWLGEFVTARTYLEQGIALYKVDHHGNYAFVYGQDPLMGCQVYLARVLWALGYPDQALQISDQAITWSQQFAHPFSLAFALLSASSNHWQRREWRASLERAGAATALCTEQGFAQFRAQSATMYSQILAMQGDEEAMDQVHQGDNC